MSNNYTTVANYMFVNKKIEKYKKIITLLYILSILMSLLIAIIQIVDKKITGTWRMWDDIGLDSGLNDNLISGYLVSLGTSVITMAFCLFYYRILSRIDSAKIYECISVKNYNGSKKSRLTILHGVDIITICIPIILDIASSFFYAMCLSAFFTNDYFLIIFARFLGTLLVAHFCGYLTIIFYFLSSKAKKKELLKYLPKYLENEKQAIIAKQKIEKAAKDKKYSQELLEQSGMKFFIKYYNQVKRLPLRDIEVDENYSPDERNERLAATKKIIDNNLTNLAIDNILENYSDILTEQELDIAKSIKANSERGK